MPRQTYARAGVDLRKVRAIQSSLADGLGSTFGFRAGKKGFPLLPIGHYAGLIDLGGKSALALHTDGVGSKVIVAQQMEKFDTVGIDCVAMTVNDLVCLGAEPVALLDYIALQHEDPPLVREIQKGLVEGARQSEVAIVGGETAILGDIIRGPGGRGFDLVSMGVALVDKASILDGKQISAGDAIIGIESSGLHSNGYTLARRVLEGTPLDAPVPGLRTSLGDALLTPTRIYAGPALEAVRDCEVHGIGHITGGSFSKLVRLVDGRKLRFDLALPAAPPLFELLRTKGNLTEREMRRTFNMGIGLCLIVPEAYAKRAARPFEKRGFRSHYIGTVKKGRGVVVDGVSLAP